MSWILSGHTIGNSLFLQTSKCSNSNCSSKGRLKCVFVSPVIGSTYLSVGFTLGLSNDRKPFQANNENIKWFSFLHQRASGFHFPLFITKSQRSDVTPRLTICQEKSNYLICRRLTECVSTLWQSRRLNIKKGQTIFCPLKHPLVWRVFNFFFSFYSFASKNQAMKIIMIVNNHNSDNK